MKTAEEILESHLTSMLSRTQDSYVTIDEMKQVPEWGACVNAIEQAQKEAYHEGQSFLKIKQLEWDFYGTYYSAETPVGHYVILQGDELHLKSFLTYLLTYSGILIADFNRFEEAKAAAQADFEKRIKECLL